MERLKKKGGGGNESFPPFLLWGLYDISKRGKAVVFPLFISGILAFIPLLFVHYLFPKTLFLKFFFNATAFL